MCGIIGYIGNKEVVPILINGLKRLEYRGYDSAGICVLSQNKLETVKKKGQITELENELIGRGINGTMGIAHTRWATHGDSSVVNAHPHLDCKNKIAIIHNGIIENYGALKKILEAGGHKIISDTDSEIVAHLIEKFYNGNLEEAVIKAIKYIEGTFGLVVICESEECIIAARRGSPLIIGIGDDEMFVTSDASAILEYTRKVIYIKDDEIVTLTKNSYDVKNLNGNLVNSEIQEIKWNLKEIEKAGFKHFMLKEIYEQPHSIENTLRGRIRDNKIKLSFDIDPKLINKIIITACGTSWHSALIGKYLIEKISGIETVVDYASEFRYRNPIIKDNDLLIAISQSGETADTLAALRVAKNCKTLGIVNVVGSSIAREVDFGIYLHAGPEIGVASTKAFTCQVTALILFSLFLRQELGLELDSKLINELSLISEKINSILDKADKIQEISTNFKDAKNFLYLGRGINFPVALEGALKLKEISYIHAEGYPAAEMKHGPIALIDENMFIVFIINRGEIFEKVISNMQEVRARGGNIITITDCPEDEMIKKLSNFIISVPQTQEELSPLINVIPLQLMSYFVADAKGLNVDKPRNLAKSVTVE
ncbi:MAG TPA: glutamine--fructose-6-phosphate transaminase (isomerizing) [bacterium]|jgi:glucosamine--fructose-6-phosphate aminotransferase (isomerizing)|nr:glutamine--fructose-6-phosphate transaminase (isomerizing) [bacterium]HOG38542.1 glutamine--fructose-6-phosphate transaminase (isomerizing) [bacterium]HQI03412.1 glutamine--fructose-6-phosphate transaminase (isomerizing) [bacterium]